MMKESIRGLRPSYEQDKQSALRTSVGGAQAAIEFKIFELEQTHYQPLNIMKLRQKPARCSAPMFHVKYSPQEIP